MFIHIQYIDRQISNDNVCLNQSLKDTNFYLNAIFYEILSLVIILSIKFDIWNVQIEKFATIYPNREILGSGAYFSCGRYRLWNVFQTDSRNMHKTK